MPESRASTAPVAVVALVSLAVCLSAVTAGTAAVSLPTPRSPAVFHLEASADGTIAITLTAGGPVDARRLGLQVRVGGRPLTDQPPIPFFAADGFRGGPRGPFNAHADPTWTVGETATFRIAHTNAPFPERGCSVTVVVTVENEKLAVLHSRTG